MASEIRVNQIQNRSGLTTVTWNDEGLNVVGVVTATSFSGSISGSTATFGSDVTISGDLGVAGTLTYEDVTRIDAVGLSTFREGFGVGPLAGIALTAYKDGSIRTSGIITASTYYGSGANLTGISQVGGATGVDFNDTVKARWGTDNDLEVVHSGSHATIKNITGNLNITNTGNNTIVNSDNITFQSGDQGETIARFLDEGACELWFDNTKRIETLNTGANVTGNVGINETSPEEHLHITHASAPGIQLEATSGGPYKTLIKMGGNDMEIRGSSGNIEFFTGNADGDSSTERLRVKSDGTIRIGSQSAHTKWVEFADSSRDDATEIRVNNGSNSDFEIVNNKSSASIKLYTNSAERMSIKPDGEIVMNAQAGVAYDTDTLFVNGPSNSGKPTVEFHGNGNNGPQANSCTLHIKQNCDGAPDTAAALKLTHTNTLAGTEGAIACIYTNQNNGTAQRAWNFLTSGRIIHNRPNNDGTLISFRHNNSAEGSISISGGTVSYNGGHLSRWSQFVGLSTTSKVDRPTIYQGTVLSNLDEMCEWVGEDNQQLNKTKISDTVGDKDVAGVFWAWDEDDDETGYVNDFFVAMTGDMVIRVAGSTSVSRGDLLESAGDGTAKPQSDDIVRSKTVAKIVSTTITATYPDGSKAYPCVLMAC